MAAVHVPRCGSHCREAQLPVLQLYSEFFSKKEQALLLGGVMVSDPPDSGCDTVLAKI